MKYKTTILNFMGKKNVVKERGLFINFFKCLSHHSTRHLYRGTKELFKYDFYVGGEAIKLKMLWKDDTGKQPFIEHFYNKP